MQDSSEINEGRMPELVDDLPGIDVLHGIAERVPAYLVGGAVRDLLLGVWDGQDLDVAIEGEVETLSEVPGFELEREGLFLTGRLELGGIKVDIARARSETYPQPGRAPGGAPGDDRRGPRPP